MRRRLHMSVVVSLLPLTLLMQPPTSALASATTPAHVVSVTVAATGVRAPASLHPGAYVFTASQTDDTGALVLGVQLARPVAGYTLRAFRRDVARYDVLSHRGPDEAAEREALRLHDAILSKVVVLGGTMLQAESGRTFGVQLNPGRYWQWLQTINASELPPGRSTVAETVVLGRPQSGTLPTAPVIRLGSASARVAALHITQGSWLRVVTTASARTQRRPVLTPVKPGTPAATVAACFTRISATLMCLNETHILLRNPSLRLGGWHEASPATSVLWRTSLPAGDYVVSSDALDAYGGVDFDADGARGLTLLYVR